MAVVTTVSNHFKYQVSKKLVDLSADTLKAILMNTTFAFNKDTHATLADVTADQLATNYGYTQNTLALTTLAVTEDDANDRSQMTCDTITWTAAGGDIGPSGALIIYDDTTTDDTVIACVDFGVDITIPSGMSQNFTNFVINLA
jgi:hypothetical protein